MVPAPGRRFRAALATVSAAALLLTGCSAQSRVEEGTTARIAVSEAFTSFNANTGFGSASATNAGIVESTSASFARWDAEGELVRDESFGSIQLVSDDPLTVRYTVASDAEWSDGVSVDAADLLLAWAANSRVLNDDLEPTEAVDAETGEPAEGLAADAVYFDGFTANGLNLVTSVPEVSADGRGITLVYDEFFADWEAIFDIGLPAHVVARKALVPDASPPAAKRAVLEAIRTNDRASLAALSRSWTHDFSVASDGFDVDDLVSSGPYTVTSIDGDTVTLGANARYRGDRRPTFETIAVRHIADPLEAVQAIDDGEVDVISPQLSQEVAAAIKNLPQEQATTMVSESGVWDLVQARTSRSMHGDIEDRTVREAFLRTVPRTDLIDAAGWSGIEAFPRGSFTMMPGLAVFDLDEDYGADALTQDPKAARKLLREAGAASPKVCVLYDPANPKRVAQFAQIRDAADEVGFKVTDCSSPDWRNLLSAPGAWDVALYGLAESTVSTQAVAARLQSGSPLNYGYFRHQEVDDALTQLAHERDRRDRTALLGKIDSLLWEQAWGVPLYQVPLVTVVGTRIEGVAPSPFDLTALAGAWHWAPANGSAPAN